VGISPLYQGDTLPALQATILDDSNNPLDLTGLTLTNFSVVIKNLYTGQVLTGAGFWTVGPDPTKGVVTYSWNAADTATAGAGSNSGAVDWGRFSP